MSTFMKALSLSILLYAPLTAFAALPPQSVISEDLRAPLPPPPLSRPFQLTEKTLLSRLQQATRLAGDYVSDLSNQYPILRASAPGSQKWLTARDKVRQIRVKFTPLNEARHNLINFYIQVIESGNKEDKRLAYKQYASRILESHSDEQKFEDAYKFMSGI